MSEKNRMLGIVAFFLLIGVILWFTLYQPVANPNNATALEIPNFSGNLQTIPDFEYEEANFNSEENARPTAAPMEETNVDAVPESTPEEIDPTLYASISGTVINSVTNEPVTEFSMFTYIGLYDYNMVKLFSPHHDKNGEFTLSGIDPNEPFSIRVRAAGYAVIAVPVEAISSDTDITGILVSLDPTKVLRGKVFDTLGNPVARAQIFSGDADEIDAARSRGGLTETDALGRFALRDIAFGMRTFTVRHEMYVNRSFTKEIHKGLSEIELILDRGATIEGKVTRNGIAAQGIRITRFINVENANSRSLHNIQIRSDVNGLFRFTQVPEGIGTIVANLAGMDSMESLDSNRKYSQQISTRSGMTTEIKLAITEDSSIEGYVMRSENETGTGVVIARYKTGASNESVQVTAGSDGYYVLTSLPPGLIALTVRDKSGLLHNFIADAPFDNKTLRMDLPLYGGTTLICRIENAPANSLLRASVTPVRPFVVQTLTSDGQDITLIVQSNEPLSNVETGMQVIDGIAALPNIHHGWYKVSVVAQLPDSSATQQSGVYRTNSTTIEIQGESEVEVVVSF